MQALKALAKKYPLNEYQIHKMVQNFLGFENFHKSVKTGMKVKVPGIGAFTFSTFKSRYRKQRLEKKMKIKISQAKLVERLRQRRKIKGFSDDTDFI